MKLRVTIFMRLEGLIFLFLILSGHFFYVKAQISPFSSSLLDSLAEGYELSPLDPCEYSENTKYIFEGVVVDQVCFKDSVYGICTAYQVDILHIFKGVQFLKLGTVTIFQQGGQVGMEGSKFSHQKRYSERYRSIFFCQGASLVSNPFLSDNSFAIRPIESIDFLPFLTFPYARGLNNRFDSHEEVYAFLGQCPKLIMPEATPDEHPYEYSRKDELEKNQAKIQKRDSLRRAKKNQIRQERLRKIRDAEQNLDSTFQQDLGEGYSLDNISTGLSARITDQVDRKKRLQDRMTFYKNLTSSNGSQKGGAGAENVTFSIDNLTLDYDSLLSWLEFDILVEGNNSGNYFDNALFWIKYDPDIFGDSIITNGLMTITRGPAFNNSTYTDPDFDAADLSSDTVAIPFGIDFQATTPIRGAVTTTSQQLLHIEMVLDSCVDPSDIIFADPSFTSFFSYYTTGISDPVLNAIPYDNTFYQGTPSTFSCKPQISNPTNPVAPGTYFPGTTTNEWELTINGNNLGFGTEVYFWDANSLEFITLDDGDYQITNSSQVVVKMPTVINLYPMDDVMPASGPFFVVNSLLDTLPGPNLLKIPYTLSNGRLTTSGKKRRGNLADLNGSGGYTFLLDTSITNYPDPGLEAVVRKAVYEWSCSTGVNFQFGDTIQDGGFLKDGRSTIFLRDSIIDGSTLGATLNSFDDCIEQFSSDTLKYVTDIDIGFRRIPSQTGVWNFDTTGSAIPANEYDFYLTALHEVGHGTGLNHTLNRPDGDLMFPAGKKGPLSSSQRLITISQAPLDGVFNQLDRSLILQFSSGCLFSPQTHFEAFPPGCAGRGIPEFSNGRSSLTIFPNPASNEVWIDISNWERECIGLLYDAQGKIQLSSSAERGSEYLHMGFDNLPPGVYFLKLVSNASELGTAKLVVVR